MVRTALWTGPWAILLARIWMQSCSANDLLESSPQTEQGGSGGPGSGDSFTKATATGGGRVLTQRVNESLRAAEDNVREAARRCIALDGSKLFPADRALGLFEIHDVRVVGTPRITAASVEIVVEERPLYRNAGGSGGARAAKPGTVGVSLRLDVDVADAGKGGGREGGGRRSAGGRWGSGGRGDSSALHGLRAANSESPPAKEEVEKAAATAAALANTPAEAQVATAALAAWNLVLTNSAMQGSTALEMRIEVAAAFGHRGDWFTASKSLALNHDDNSDSGGGVVPLSATFDWQPPGGVWALLDGPAVADVKVYGAIPAVYELPVATTTKASTSPRQGESLLLEATLCKRASQGSSGRAARQKAAATLISSSEQAEQAYQRDKQQRQPLERETGAPADSTAAAPSPRPPVIVCEMDDGEWWEAREEEQYGRGMHAVNALSRLPGWKPGDWKKRQRRRRRQEEERARRRKAKAIDQGGGGSKRDDGGGVKTRRRSGSGAMKRAWRRIGRLVQSATRKFHRKKKRT